jgi:hypothetical protein
MAHKSKFRNIFPLIFIFVFITVIFAKFVYENRCHFINCSPASWDQILKMAFAQAETDFRIQSIWARPSRWNRYTENGPAFIDITISYISPNIDSSRADEETNHPTKNIEFDDQNLITDIRTGNSWANFVPPEDRQEKLRRVSVHPRDAFRTTWTLAKKESGLSPDNASVLAILSFDERGYESIWSVYYHYDTLTITFYINAQTAQIISVEKKVVSK